MVYQCEKTLTDFGDKVDGAEKDAIQAKIDSVKEALKGEDIEKIKSSTEELQQEIYKISEKIYKAEAEAAQAAQGAAGADVNSGANADNVYEADYTEVDDTQN